MSMSVIAGSETDDEMDTEIPRPFFNKVFEFPLPSPLWTLWTVWESEKSFLDDVGRNPFWRKDDLTQKLVETVNNAGGRQIVKLNFCSIYVATLVDTVNLNPSPLSETFHRYKVKLRNFPCSYYGEDNYYLELDGDLARLLFPALSASRQLVITGGDFEVWCKTIRIRIHDSDPQPATIFHFLINDLGGPENCGMPLSATVDPSIYEMTYYKNQSHKTCALKIIPYEPKLPARQPVSKTKSLVNAELPRQTSRESSTGSHNTSFKSAEEYQDWLHLEDSMDAVMGNMVVH